MHQTLSEKAIEIENEFGAHNYHPLPVVLNNGEGVYVWDVDDKKYFDASSGPVATNLGHGNKKVLKAMKSQSDKVCFASYSVFQNEPNRILAKNLVNLAGSNYDQNISSKLP